MHILVRRSLVALFLGGLVVSPSVAQRAELSTTWWLEPSAPPPGIRHLAGKEHVLKQRLLPAGLAKLGRAVSKAEASFDLPAGTELIQVKGGTGPIFCDGQLQKAQGCLLDSDSDRRFDSAFRTWSQTPALVMINGPMPTKLMTLASPIPYENLDPATSTLDAFVAIERRNWFNIYGLESFTILFGSSNKQERITDPVQFKSTELPKQLNILGSNFTVLSEKDGRMAVRVDVAMPRQPFRVTKTISFR